MSLIFQSDFNCLYQNGEWKEIFDAVIPKTSFTEVCFQPIFYALHKILDKITSQLARNILKGIFLAVCSPVLLVVLIVSMLWRFVKAGIANNIFVFGIFCVQPWLNIGCNYQASQTKNKQAPTEKRSIKITCGAMIRDITSAIMLVVAYIAFFPLIEVIIVCGSVYQVIFRDLSLMYKFCQLCGNEAHKNSQPGNSNNGEDEMLNGCYALNSYPKDLKQAFSSSVST